MTEVARKKEPRFIYIAEQGLYEERGVVGIFDSAERAMGAMPGKTWRKTTWTDFPKWPLRDVVEHWVSWENELDWEGHVSISERELTESGSVRDPDEEVVQTYRESDGGWDYVPGK